MTEEWKRTLRTAVQIVSAVAVAVPVLLPAIGVSTTVGVGATVLAVAVAVTRVMQNPTVASLLNKYLKIPMP